MLNQYTLCNGVTEALGAHSKFLDKALTKRKRWKGFSRFCEDFWDGQDSRDFWNFFGDLLGFLRQCTRILEWLALLFFDCLIVPNAVLKKHRCQILKKDCQNCLCIFYLIHWLERNRILQYLSLLELLRLEYFQSHGFFPYFYWENLRKVFGNYQNYFKS